jgi:hypothetical protein
MRRASVGQQGSNSALFHHVRPPEIISDSAHAGKCSGKTSQVTHRPPGDRSLLVREIETVGAFEDGRDCGERVVWARPVAVARGRPAGRASPGLNGATSGCVLAPDVRRAFATCFADTTRAVDLGQGLSREFRSEGTSEDGVALHPSLQSLLGEHRLRRREGRRSCRPGQPLSDPMPCRSRARIVGTALQGCGLAQQRL